MKLLIPSAQYRPLCLASICPRHRRALPMPCSLARGRYSPYLAMMSSIATRIIFKHRIWLHRQYLSKLSQCHGCLSISLPHVYMHGISDKHTHWPMLIVLWFCNNMINRHAFGLAWRACFNGKVGNTPIESIKFNPNKPGIVLKLNFENRMLAMYRRITG